MAGTGKHIARVARLVIAASLGIVVMASLSGCLGFDVHISTPFDEIEQGIENFERGIEDGFSEYGDGEGRGDGEHDRDRNRDDWDNKSERDENEWDETDGEHGDWDDETD